MFFSVFIAIGNFPALTSLLSIDDLTGSTVIPLIAHEAGKKHTNTQIHKYTNIRIYGYTNIQIYKNKILDRIHCHSPYSTRSCKETNLFTKDSKNITCTIHSHVITFLFAANRKYALDTIVKLNLNLKQRSTILKAKKAKEAE